MASKPVLVAFDPADHLVDDAAIAQYLTEALCADDAAHFQDALQVVARARGMAQIAEASGLGRESLYKALKPGAHPRFDTVQRVLGALGVRLIIEPLEQPGTA
jgi:probable addiction module antidote protein